MKIINYYIFNHVIYVLSTIKSYALSNNIVISNELNNYDEHFYEKMKSYYLSRYLDYN